VKYLIGLTILVAIMLIGCSRANPLDPSCERGSCAYYGLEDFGYQWSRPSPYADWLPDGERSRETYRYEGIRGPNGHIVINFPPLENIDSTQQAIAAVLDLEPTAYDILEENTVQQGTKQVEEIYLSVKETPDKPYIRLAIYPFDGERWAIIYGHPEPGRERRFNSSFDTILWSLDPYRTAPSVVVTMMPP
jgi:hypothetical protein